MNGRGRVITRHVSFGGFVTAEPAKYVEINEKGEKILLDGKAASEVKAELKRSPQYEVCKAEDSATSIVTVAPDRPTAIELLRVETKGRDFHQGDCYTSVAGIFKRSKSASEKITLTR